MRNIETFLTDTQKNVSGEVWVSLQPYRFFIDGIQSRHDLMNAKFGSYGEMQEGWTSDDAKGFIKIVGNATKIYQSVNSSFDD
jgi:argininosuccinate synthase